jgi:hypothetical protein
MNGQISRYGLVDVASHFGVAPADLPAHLSGLIESSDLSYRPFVGEVRDKLIERILAELERPLEVAGKHRHARWEAGWSENLEAFRASSYDLSALVPKFVRRGEPVRMLGDYIQPLSQDFDVDYIRLIVSWLYLRYFSETSEIHEFGCGTAQNLVPAALIYPGRPLFGYDWATASRLIIEDMARYHHFNIQGRVLDMFAPDVDVTLAQGAGVVTIGSLEQLGTDFNAFLDFLLAKRPGVVANVDCFNELYLQDHLPDQLAYRYDRKRGYLFGWIDRLREHAAAGRLEILDMKRTYGNLFHDGHSYVVWRPK